MTETRPTSSSGDPSAVACLVGFGSTLAVLALTEQFQEFPAAVVACAAGWFIVRRGRFVEEPHETTAVSGRSSCRRCVQIYLNQCVGTLGCHRSLEE